MEKKGSIQFFDLDQVQRGYELVVIELPEMFEAWITKKGYGISEFLFGCRKEQTIFGKKTFISWDEFVDMAISFSESYKPDFGGETDDEAD